MAIVGSRAATPYALEVAARLAAELAAAAWSSSVWRAAPTAQRIAAVSAPAARRSLSLAAGPTRLSAASTATGRKYLPERALVSELGPGGPPLPEHFPQRNRLISGISLAVVVVEASERSGSLITARCALEQGRDVMAVPGNVLSGRNRGSHALLKDGAKVVESVDDILGELGWPAAAPSPEARASMSGNVLKKDVLLDRMAPGETSDLDALCVEIVCLAWRHPVQ